MINLLISGGVVLLLGFSGFATPPIKPALPQTSKIFLRDGWRIQSSAQIKEKGDVLSRSTFQPKDWYSATVPSTVVGALVTNKVYAEPLVDENLRSIPGCSYPIGANFSNLPMPENSPFRVSWWYRTQFRLPESYRGKSVWLHFDGINFRANIWLNGRQIATSSQVAGTFRIHELNVRNMAHVGELNTLAVEILPHPPHAL